ncbi:MULTISPECIES: hypothetical protein [Vibrio]|nr:MULTISPECIES: hypothetical protein [Vibrio]MDA0126364.1 hypothetical protein [Vibrio sp. MM46]MDG2630428.1 hypothetical protein [Vibrio parahaemolyticus]WVM82553.1 hypothetical protein V1M48_16670 [Vibrio harveyi]GEA20039.1 hypothetical protein VH1807_contig00001-0122 [Vibrio harveyi]
MILGINAEDGVFFIYPLDEDLNGQFLIQVDSQEEAERVKTAIENRLMLSPIESTDSFTLLRVSAETPIYTIHCEG